MKGYCNRIEQDMIKRLLDGIPAKYEKPAIPAMNADEISEYMGIALPVVQSFVDVYKPKKPRKKKPALSDQLGLKSPED